MARKSWRTIGLIPDNRQIPRVLQQRVEYLSGGLIPLDEHRVVQLEDITQTNEQ